MGKKDLVSTGKAAKIFSVTPDTVLKWIKRGRLPAVRTVGGHYRLSADLLPEIKAAAQAPQVANAETIYPSDQAPGFLHCWEYYSEGGEPREQCRECLVYEAKALRCFEMSRLPKESGFAGTFCKTSCEDCPYYQEQYRRHVKVLVITDSIRLRKRIAAEAESSRFEIRFASSGYECSAIVESFKPEFVVMDSSLPTHTREELCVHLANDPRVPDVKIVLAGQLSGEETRSEAPAVAGEIPNFFSLADLDCFVTGRQVQERDSKAGTA